MMETKHTIHIHCPKSTNIKIRDVMKEKLLSKTGYSVEECHHYQMFSPTSASSWYQVVSGNLGRYRIKVSVFRLQCDSLPLIKTA